MKTYLVSIALFILFHSMVLAQSSKDPINVYLLGTFHFDQTDSTYDVLSDEHQKSIAELCGIIKRVHPDKVFIERMPDYEYESRMDSLYQSFRKGDSRQRRNEIWQVAFRVARDLNHPTIYSCDHPGQYGFLYGQIEVYANTHHQVELLAGKGKGMTVPLTSYVDLDSLHMQVSVLEYMRWINSKPVQQSSHASYINLYPQLGNTDVFTYTTDYFLGSELTADWYRRNIKIYSKIIAQLDYSEKGIFLLMGNDHMPVIRHLFESNPYFKVVDTKKWLGKSDIRIP